MTDPTPLPQPGEFVIKADGNDEMAALLAEFEAAHAVHAAATERLDMLKAKLKYAMFDAAAGHGRYPVIALQAPGRRGVVMRSVVSWRLNTKRLKAEQPETYARYAEQSGTWKLEQARS